MSDAFLAQQWPRLTPDPNLGRWAPKFDAPDNPYDELDNELKGPPPTQEEVPEGKPLLQKTSSESPYADLDAELDKDSKLGPGDKWLANHLPEWMAKGIRQSPQAAEISQLGPGAASLQTGSRGLVRGMGAGVVGTGALLRGGKEIVTGHPEPAFERANKWLEATGTALPQDASTGERIAYGAGTMIPGTALPIAMGAGVLPTVAGTLAGPLVGGATEKVAGALGLPERFGPLAGLIGGIAGGGGGSAAAERALERAVAPTRLDLKAAGKAARQDIKATGVTLEPTSVINQVIDPFTDEVGDQGRILGKQAWQLVNSLKPKDADEGVVPIGKLLGTRSALGKMTRERDPVTRELTPQAGVASNAYGKITDYINSLKDNPWYIVDAMGDKRAVAQSVSDKFAESNANYAAGIRSGNFMRNVYNKPMQKVSSTYTSGNSINQVRQGARYMLDPDHPERITGWSDQEKAALNGVLHGVNPVQNLARAVGVLGPGSQLSLWAAGLGGASALSGNLAGLVLPGMMALGWGARKIGQAAQRRQINNLDKQIRLRSPLGTKLNSEAEGGNEAEEAEGGIAGINAENLSEITHHGMQTGADISRGARAAIGAASGQSMGETDEDKKKKDEGGGYAMGHRLLKAVGGYDSSFFSGGPLDEANTEVAINRASGATPRDILKSVTSPTAQGIGQDIGMAMAPIEAYHGSPYDFDQFKSEKIGTGEGAQAYGHGLYFAEKEGVAKDYRDKLSESNARVTTSDPQYWELAQHGNNMLPPKASPADGMRQLEAYAEEGGEGSIPHKVLQAIKSGNLKLDYPGHMYQVEIGSEPEHFLDWDKPLSEQSEHVQKFFADNPDFKKQDSANSRLIKDYKGMSGSQAYSLLSKWRQGSALSPSEESGADASKALQDAGIPGIRYLDQGSRIPPMELATLQRKVGDAQANLIRTKAMYNVRPEEIARAESQLNNAQSAVASAKAKQTHNYVVFDPSIIRIMRKYGIFGPAAVAGSQMGQQKKQGGGGYDNPAGQVFADPEAFRLRMARLAAMPRTGVGGSSLTPQTAVGGGIPMGSYQVGGYSHLSAPSIEDYPFRPQGQLLENASPGSSGWRTKNIPPVIDYQNIIQRQLEGLPGQSPDKRGGYNWLWGSQPKSRPEPVDMGNPSGSKYTFGSFSTVTRPKPPPRGGASMQDPQSDDVGGYDDAALSNPMGPDFQFGQTAAPALAATGTAIQRGLLDPFAANVAASVPYPGVPLEATAGPLWQAIGRARGARRFGGYGMGQVSPLAGGGGY